MFTYTNLRLPRNDSSTKRSIKLDQQEHQEGELMWREYQNDKGESGEGGYPRLDPLLAEICEPAKSYQRPSFPKIATTYAGLRARRLGPDLTIVDQMAASTPSSA